MNKEIMQLVTEIEPNLIKWRRDFHKYAESAWTEFRTSSIIAKELSDLGYEVLLGNDILNEEDRMGVPAEHTLEEHYQRALKQGAVPEFAKAMQGGFTGVVGVLKCGEGPVLALRFDIDAVEMKESNSTSHRPVKEGFSSINDQAMHSCGHDGHAAVGLGVATLISKLKDKFCGTVKIIFQAAEEGVRGAKSLVTKGILDEVDFLFAAHLISGTKLGEIACGRSDFLATKKFDAFITGAPAHAGGAPQRGKNALLAASTAVLNLYAIPRHSDGATRINVGRLSAGTGRNVIAPNAHLVVETRGEVTELSEYMYDYAMKVVKNAASMHECLVDIVAMGEAKSGVSNKELAQKVYNVASASDLFDNVKLTPENSLGSEDYTYMMAKVQQTGGMATFIDIGADLGGWAHHTADFDFNEDALAKSVNLFLLLALDILK